MKKVLFIIDTLQTGGAEKSLLEISSRFTDFQPVFIQLFPGDTLQKEFASRNIEVIPMGFKVSYSFKEIARKLVPVVKELNPTIIHSTLFRSDMVARHLKEMLNLPLINSFVNNSYSVQRYSEMKFINRLKLYIIQQWDKIRAKKVDLFISNSETIKNTNAKALNYPLEKIQVIYRGRSLDDYSNSKNEKNIENLKLNLNIGKRKVILNVSRLLDRKGQLDLIKAFSSFAKEFPDAILLIAGEGPYRSVLEKEIENNNLQNVVRLLGNRKDVPALLNIADLFVFPSYYEGLPGALIEAMLTQTPIVASDIPENKECVPDNGGLFFRIGDTNDLTKKIQEAFSTNKDIWKRRIDDSYSYAINNFEISEVSRQYEEVYKKFLNTNR